MMYLGLFVYSAGIKALGNTADHDYKAERKGRLTCDAADITWVNVYYI